MIPPEYPIWISNWRIVRRPGCWHNQIAAGADFTGCGKTRCWCHSERSEESLCALDLDRREILRFAQNDKRTFSADCVVRLCCLVGSLMPSDGEEGRDTGGERTLWA